jgi:phosphatidylglycerol---prolipoprotein diacylglyceryl transferase
MINPIAFVISNVAVAWYDLAFAFGFITAFIVLLVAIRKKEIEMEEHQALVLLFLWIFGVLIGAKLFTLLFWNPSILKNNPLAFLKFWGPGRSFHGGLTGIIIVTYLYTKFKKINFWKVADIVTLPAIFAHGLVRIANFMNQNIVGTITNVSWCMESPHYPGCRHPVTLYASAGRFALFFALYAIKQLKSYKPGFIFWLYIFIGGLGRFFMDFLREGVKHFGLLSGQWLSIPMILIGGFVLYRYYRKDVKNLIKN